MFKPVTSKVNFPELEADILTFWKERRIFQRSVEERRGADLFTIYEGPPTANASPGVHHVLARIFKDVIPRYKTMKGYNVPRKGGWDTHGLPVELEIERELGLSSKREIEDYGIDKFNARCRDSVFRYVKEWEALTERIGFWVDMENPYITFTNDYIESCWWIVKQLWDKGLVYRGYKVTPHCPRCGTSLSSHEVALGYKEDTPDPSVYVKFKLTQKSKSDLYSKLGLEDDGVENFLLAWTTTPWTLLGNTALAVAKDAEYALVELDKAICERLILATARLESALKEPYQIVATLKGADVVGLEYESLYNLLDYPEFPYVEKFEGGRTRPSLSWAGFDPLASFRVVAGNFVSMDDGTGIVHIAPAYGEVDMELGRQEDLWHLHPVRLSGKFDDTLVPFAGIFVKDADPLIIQDLRARGLLYREETIRHTYPFCWRCDTPLLYYAKTSWYIRTTAVKERLIANNQEINWYPEHIKSGRFGDWLQNNVDWALSRERYWGTPLPIWRCEACGQHDCIGSRVELQAKPGYAGTQGEFDLHRPFIDDATFTCSQCSGTMRRVPEVMDAWFDSGAMPVAQWHYPFENQDLFERSFPADYICEAVDQTRGWFYTLHALATLLFDKPAYRNVICLGHILDAKGEKMSKSKGNAVPPQTVIDVYGADALRWYLYTAAPPGNSRRFSAELVAEALRKFLLTLWNTYSFFVTYANIDNFDPRASSPPVEERSDLDRWILSRLQGIIQGVDQALDGYDPTDGARQIQAFVDDLSNWYVRRSRRRFWKSENDADKAAAYFTLSECLVTLAKLLAPFTPFVAEEMYQNLVRSVSPEATESVHLAQFPEANLVLRDEALETGMGLVMNVVSLGRAGRSPSVTIGVTNLGTGASQVTDFPLRPERIKVRQPLAKVLVKVDTSSERKALSDQISQVLEELNVKELAFIDDLAPFEQVIQEKGLSIESSFRLAVPDYYIAKEGNYWVVLDTRLTPELEDEGRARELVHRIQGMRRAAGFDIADRIRTYYWEEGDNLVQVVQRFEDYIKRETLSLEVLHQTPPKDSYTESHRLERHQVVLGVKKV
ncbi:MAG: isoleucine--tRNA ligase [Chloroflexi bacterium]|nr:isoleucine--tRNA ligase [Chloroflexota bacterium]